MRKAPIVVAFLVLLVAGSLALTRTPEHFPLLHKAYTIEHEAAQPELDSATAALVNQYDAYVQKSLEREQFPGAAVVIVKDGQVIFSKGYGVKSLHTNDSINTHTVFRLASLSKGFAGVLAGVLVKDGYFKWDDPVVHHLPDFRLRQKEQTQALTIRRVLSHTTGLPRQTFSNLIEAGDSYALARNRLAEIRLPHEPGTRYNYQNVAFSLIGDVAEKTTGVRFEDLLYRRIFLPLGMTDAGAGYSNFMLDSNNVAWPHRVEKEGYQRTEVLPNYYEVSPAAGVNASISDMGAWLLFLMGKRPDVLSADILDTIFSRQIAVPLVEGNHRAYPEATEAWYGLGWRGVTSHGRKVIFHGGYVNGFRSEIAFIPSENIGIAILSNAPSWFINSSVPRFLEMHWGLPYEQS